MVPIDHEASFAEAKQEGGVSFLVAVLVFLFECALRIALLSR